jgi:hypothetical protein
MFALSWTQNGEAVYVVRLSASNSSSCPLNTLTASHDPAHDMPA